MKLRVLAAPAAVAVVVAVVVACPPLGLAAPPADLQVVESTGIAAVGGVITRVPAESPGGAVYSDTSVNLDKARGTAAGFTAGNLVEIFFGTSSEDYRNPTLVRSQYPPSEVAPEEATSETGQSGESGTTMVATTKSTEQPSALSTATAESLPGEVFSITAGRSGSASFVQPDGSVGTETHASAGEVVVGDVVRFTDFSSVAIARVDASGRPAAQTDSTVGGVFVNDVPARLSDDGLEIAGNQLVGPAQLAQFNAGLAQLEERGITVAGVRAEITEEPGRARAAGAVAVVRYSLPAGPIPNSIGNDEEFLLGQVFAESIAVRRPETGPLPPLAESLPAVPGSGGPVVGAGNEVAPVPAVTPSAEGVAPIAAPVLTGVGSPGYGAGAAPLPAPVEPVPATGARPAVGPGGAADEFTLAEAARVTPAGRLRGGYGIFILAALAGAVLLVARSRTRLA